MKAARSAPLLRRLFRSLGSRAGPLLAVIEEASRRDVRVYLVGGPVRDLLLGLPARDIDVLLSDRLEDVAEASARALSGRARRHARFLTATVEGDGFRIDLSRARKEVYPTPGALPRVRPAELEEDFERRDFSVNAMALPLDPSSGDSVVDLHGGLEDLESRRLRVLHPKSFIDDPTRLYRAARYMARLRFRLEPQTARWAREAVRERAVETLTPVRVWHEIERLLEEASSARAATQTARLGLLAAAVPAWTLGAEGASGLRRLDRSRSRPPWPEAAAPPAIPACGLRLLLLGVAKQHRARALERLGIIEGAAARIERDLEPLRRRLRALSRQLSPGRLDAQLSEISEPGLLLLYCTAPRAAQRRVARYARELRHLKSALTGQHATALGARGPLVGELLRAARQRTLDGRPVGEEWARRWLARHRRMG